MTQPKLNSLSQDRALPPFLPVLLLLFVGSGCAALIYEIVWLQLLQLVIGSTAVSLGVLLGTFMGGMCLGSLLLPRLVSRRRHPLRVYAFLELSIGVFGIGILFLMPLVEQIYALYGGHGLAGIFLRGVVAGVCVLPPTLLMGATLPAIARWVETTPAGVSWLGFFYGGNIAGAVFGSLMAGFYLLRIYDVRVASYTAVAINVVVALVALAVSALADSGVDETLPKGSLRGRLSAGEDPPAATDCRWGTAGWAPYVVIALSGMSALGAEVVWTRLLSLLLGGTVYTFSIILAVFLTGLGIGSTIAALLARTTISPRVALGACQMLLIGGIGWTGFTISQSLPYWPINPGIYGPRPGFDLPSAGPDPWPQFQLDMARCLWAILLPACLWGASFPLTLAAVAAGRKDAGRLVGGVYAANTVGAIAGALAFSLLVIPRIGTLGAERVLVGLAAAAAVVALAPLFWRARAPATEGRWQAGGGRADWQMDVGIAVSLTVALVAAGFSGFGLKPIPWGMVGYGRYVATWNSYCIPDIVDEKEVPRGDGQEVYCTYVGEGMNVSVAVTLNKAGVKSFHGAGKVQASTGWQDMRLQRMLGHLSALVHKKPEKVLVVACGAGVTAGSFVVHPEVERIVICDIEPLVPTVVTPMFGTKNYHVVDGIAQENPRTVKFREEWMDGDHFHSPLALQRSPLDPPASSLIKDKQVEVVYDDGRHFIRTTREKFDIITSDPIDPWVKGCAALNTVEYYQMCKEHLKPGGVMSLWIPLYECNEETAKSVIKTFFEVFPNGILWSNDTGNQGYDAVLFGQVEPTVIDIDALEKRLDRPDHQFVKKSLEDVSFGTKNNNQTLTEPSPYGVAIDLLATYAGQAPLLGDWSRGAQLNTDRNLRLQYLAGMWLNSYMGPEILNGILAYYHFPENTFVGSPGRIQALKNALNEAGRKESLTTGS
jgi:spermidine synthase